MNPSRTATGNDRSQAVVAAAMMRGRAVVGVLGMAGWLASGCQSSASPPRAANAPGAAPLAQPTHPASSVPAAHDDKLAAVNLAASNDALTIDRPGLYPETVVYDGVRKRLLVGSMREGAIYTIETNGHAAPFVDDARLTSVLGIALDPGRKRLWAVNADLGIGQRQSAAGPKAEAGVAVYDLETGGARNWIDVSRLVSGPHLLNGIAIDGAGDAYVTDSFSPAIYRVTSQGDASVLVKSSRFGGAGVNLNGLVVHPGGYLLVVKKSDGALFRVPLANPTAFTEVTLPRPIPGADGVVLANPNQLVVIANKTQTAATNAALVLRTSDDWKSASLVATQPLGDVYPTTATVRDGQLLVLHTNLDELLGSSPETRPTLARRATLRPIGSVSVR
jgi:hypothetical protein